jgi:hypothetical protein
VQLAGEEDWQGLSIESKTIGVRLPEGYQLPATSTAAAEGGSKETDGQVQDGDDVQMADGQEQQPAADTDVSGRKRRREEVEAVCKQVEAETQGAVRMWLLPGSAGSPADEVPVCMECTAQPAVATAAGQGTGTAGAAGGDAESSSSSSSSPWKRLKLLLPASYPQQPPVLVFQPGKALTGPEEQQQQQQDKDSAVNAVAIVPQGATGQQQQQQLLAEEAWAELQAALWEEPLTDLKGVAKHWCQAVGAVVVQRGLLPSSSR